MRSVSTPPPEARKLEEAEFHDKLRGLYETDPERYGYFTSNKKFYSVVKSSDDFYYDWLRRNATGKRILDFGCGSGTHSTELAHFAGHVTGIDMTPAMLNKARAAATQMGATNVEFVESEAEQLPFADGSFDVVVSNGVIDLIPDKDAVFAELYRVLAPGGRLQIADVTIQNPVSAEGRRNIDLWTG